MVLLLIAQLVAINSDWKIGVIIMNISILCFILLKYIFSNRGSVVLNKGLSLDIEQASIMEIIIGWLLIVTHMKYELCV